MAEDKQSSKPINSGGPSSLTAPTPVNTPLNAAPISHGLSRPTVPDIDEEEGDQQGQDLISKLHNLNIRPSGIVEVLPAPVARRVEGLKGVHTEYCKIEHELKREMLELEKKYLLKFTPIFERRKAILLGDSEPTREEVAAGEAVSEKDDPEAAAVAKEEREEAEKNLSAEDKAIKGIPNFWLTALRNHDGLSDLITEKDEEALTFLTDIRLVYLADTTPGFKLIFEFAPNPYFENETLEKSYHYQDELGDTGDYIYDRAVGTEIRWKEEKDLTKAVEIKKQRNKTTNRTRLIRRSHTVPSFFNFFNPPAQPTREQVENGEVDEELLEELDEKLELDYQIGEDLKERIIPRAIDYFTGKALEYDLEGIEDEDDYEDLDDDEFEDEITWFRSAPHHHLDEEQDSILNMSHTARQYTRATRAVAVEQSEIAPGGEGASSSAAGSVAQVTSVPPRKQARTTKSTRSKKKKVDSLSGLLTLPVELFTEVMRELKPIDILNLSRTCKSFRNILMRRSSEPIWQRAAKNLSYRLPPPPPWLDMPQYVSVVYTDDCSACGSKAVPKKQKWDPEFQPALLVRLCVACQPNVLIRSTDIPESLKPLVVVTHVNIFPGAGIEMNSGQYGLRVELRKIKKEFKTNKVKFADDKKKFRAWKRAKSQFVERYSKIQRNYWSLIRNIEDDREAQRGEVKRQFQHGVEKRLTELGWEHDISYAFGKEWRSLVLQPRNLTDRIWKNLYPKLQNILEQAQSRRLAELPLLQQKFLITLWSKKHYDLGTRVIVHPQHVDIALKPVDVRLAPPASEAMNWPLVKQILEPCPSAQDIKNRVSESWEIIRPLTETWQRGVESQLASRLEDDEVFSSVSDPNASALVISGQPVPEDLNVLLRADSVFRFADNTVRCFPGDFLETWHPQGICLMHSLVATSPPIVESAQSFTVAREQAKALLQCLGHPNASHLGMSACGKRFVCGTCAHWQLEYLKVYDWKGLLGHYTSAKLDEPEDGTAPDPTREAIDRIVRHLHCPEPHDRSGHPLVHILSFNDARKYAQDTSTLLTERPWSNYSEKHACIHCTDCSGVDLPAILAHVQYTHYIVEPEAHRDYENYEVYIRQSLGATYEYED